MYGYHDVCAFDGNRCMLLCMYVVCAYVFEPLSCMLSYALWFCDELYW